MLMDYSLLFIKVKKSDPKSDSLKIMPALICVANKETGAVSYELKTTSLDDIMDSLRKGLKQIMLKKNDAPDAASEKSPNSKIQAVDDVDEGQNSDLGKVDSDEEFKEEFFSDEEEEEEEKDAPQLREASTIDA